MPDEPESTTVTFPAKRFYRQADTATPKPKRSRKASTTKRVRQPKPQAILDIEKQAADLKAKYRLAQSSGGVLKRIREKMLPRLTPEHRQELFDELSKTETPALLTGAGGGLTASGKAARNHHPLNFTLRRRE